MSGCCGFGSSFGGPGGATVETPSAASYLPEQWNQNNVAASQTDVALETLVSANFATFKTVRGGSIVGLVTRLSEAITAGQLTVEVTINGAGTGLIVTHTNAANQTGGVATQAVSTDTYTASALIGVRLTTNGTFAPTTTDLEASISVFESL